MKTSSQFLLIASLALAAGAAPAFASPFDFSYNFNDGSGLVVTGTLDGTVDGQFLDNVSNVTLQFNGASVAGSIFTSQVDSTFSTNIAGSVVSFDAAQNNFYFADADLANGDAGFDNLFAMSNDGSSSFALAVSNSAGLGQEDYPSVSASWSLTAAAPAAASDAGATALLLGGALLGLVGFRRFALV